MATVEIDFEVLRQMFMPGLKVQIDRASIVSDPMRDALALDLSGPDVPQCERALIVMTQHVDDHDAIVRTATLKPIED